MEHGAKEQANIDVIRVVAEEVFSGGKLERLEELLHTEYEDHSAPPGFRDRAGFRAIVEFWRTNTSSFQAKVEHIFASGDFVGMVDQKSGVHDKAPLFGIPPNGKSFSFQSVHAFRFVDGKLRDHWVQTSLPMVLESWSKG
jgi:nogalonic acid methyl ester cyclase/aklanonic acid methyl ester cyclase